MTQPAQFNPLHDFLPAIQKHEMLNTEYGSPGRGLWHQYLPQPDVQDGQGKRSFWVDSRVSCSWQKLTVDEISKMFLI